MAMVTSNGTTLLKAVKPFKTGWKVEIKVLHSWTQHSSYGGGDTLEFILADVTGDKIHCTCKRIFTPRAKKHMLGGQWCFIENFGLTPATGKYRATSHKYKLSIIGSSLVTSSSLKIDGSFLSLTPYESINNGSLDSNFSHCFAVSDVISQAIDIGDLQVVQFLGKERKKLELSLTDTNHQHIACCLWGRFAEQVLNAYHVGDDNTIVCLVTNAFEASSVIINPTGSDVNEFLR
ncbi:unnamed protein product [Brassica oleracea]